ncbi:MAG TPA: cobalamin biosynthesis protein [Burkholderiales bacterium]|nr:cobalamin biosynthesis protein [Burkholderiales bacterium]
MSFLALLLTFLLEQWRPLVDRRAVFGPMTAYASYLERHLDAGGPQQGAVAWLLAVVPIVIASWALYAALAAASPLLGLACNVAALYATMDFRQHSHLFNDIHKALKEGDLVQARQLLAAWRGHSCETLSATEVARLAIERALVVSHRHVFGVMFWFLLLPGPSGAVLYRLARFLSNRWRDPSGDKSKLVRDELPTGVEAADAGDPAARATEGGPGRFGEFAGRAFHALDWLPARFTAASFAIVGDFEDAAYCWRTQASRWPDPLVGVLLASGAGAIGVRLGLPIACGATVEDRPELGLGAEADIPFLDTTVGLIWRALVLWLALILVITIAAAFG